MTDFERQVLEDLAMLKTQMKSLLGNGQPGRLHHLESSVERHETALQKFAGAGVLFGSLLTLFHLGIDFLRKH
jgi:hypothetical protein